MADDSSIQHPATDIKRHAPKNNAINFPMTAKMVFTHW
jgi:hypothetical protein